MDNVSAQMEANTMSGIITMGAKVWHALTENRVVVTRGMDHGAIEKSHVQVRYSSQLD